MALSYQILNNKTIIRSDYLNDSLYNLLDQTFEIPLTGFSFNVLLVDEEYIARPDLISLDAYGDSQYADIICKLNGISNPFELNKGMEIIIPTASTIDSFRVKPGIYDKEDIPIKQTTARSIKSVKRKANEALISDTRFRIDASNGFVIY